MKVYIITANRGQGPEVMTAFTTGEDAKACVNSLQSLRANANVEYRILPRTLYEEWK